MQQEQIKQQYELLNLTRIVTAENRKLLMKLDKELLHLNASFAVLSRETIMLTFDKNFILTMLHLRGKIAVLQDRLTQIQFDIQNIYSDIETLSTSTINPTLINPTNLQYLCI